jgi:CRISPR-associated protein Cas1
LATVIKRTVEISREPTHLCVRDRQLWLLRKDDEERRPSLSAHPPNLMASIPTEDIGMVLVDEGRTTYTHAALAELVDRGAVVVICGRDHMPSGLLLPLGEHTEVVWRLKDQIRATRPLRKQLWKSIIQAKIRAQAEAVSADAPTASPARDSLLALARAVKSGDTENHEAQAARLYWSAWLGDPRPGPSFTRVGGNPDAPPPNNFLDYGYAVLRAAIARALVGAGLLPALGIKHRNRSNAFCLADDLIEPLRPMVDERARAMFVSGVRTLTQESKAVFLVMLTATVRNSAGTGPLMVALHRYTASLSRSYSSGEDVLDIPVPLAFPGLAFAEREQGRVRRTRRPL